MTDGNDEVLSEAALDAPHVRAFLPMLYVAWADGELTDDEIRTIRGQLDEMPWVHAGARKTLERLLDPKAPPSAETLRRVLTTVREAAGNLDDDRRLHLARLGAALASDDPNVEEAVETLLAALSIDGAEAGRALLGGRPTAGAPTEPKTAFDPEAVRAVLEPRCKDVRSKVRALLADADVRIERDQSKADAREAVLAVVKRLADEGFGNLAYPGVTTQGESLEGFMTAFEMLGFGDLSVLVKFGVQFGLFGGSIYFLGTEEQRKRFLPDTAKAELLGCFAMTELGHGSNVMGLKTTATYDPESDSIVVHTPDESARKEWIGNAAAHARMATVFAQLSVGGQDHGVHAVLVPIRDETGEALPGVRLGDCGHKLGLNGVDNGRIWFDQVKVPRDHLLGRFASITESGEYTSPIASPNKRFFTMLGTLVAGRVSVGSGGVSASKVGLAIATRYAFHRRQFGAPGVPENRLIDYPIHRRRLMPALAQTYAASFAIEHVRRTYVEADGEEERRAVEALAAGIKAFATDHATFALQKCRECCGGQGYLSANRIGPLKSDTDVFTTFEGDNTVLLQLVAKAALTDFRKELTDDRVFGLIRYVGKKIARVAKEANPITSRLSSAEHLRDRDTLRGLFEFRESHLVEAAARRIQKRIGQGMKPHEAFTDIQSHLVAMAKAHVERVVFDAFATAVDGAAGEAKEALDRLLDLWSLWRIEEDLGWFMENGVAEPSRASGVREQVQTLCDAVAEDALAYVEAFGIPETSLAAPIAFGSDAGV